MSAKSIGLRVVVCGNLSEPFCSKKDDGAVWNPLTNGQHAFELMVAHRIDVLCNKTKNTVVAISRDHRAEIELDGDDDVKKYRIAVVKVAAMIGSEMGVSHVV